VQKGADLVTKGVALAVSANITLAAAVRQIMLQQIKDIQDQLSKIPLGPFGIGLFAQLPLLADLAKLQQAVDAGVPDSTVGTPAARGLPDPVAKAQADKAAQTKRDADAKAAAKLADDNRKARHNLDKVQAEGDPVAQAQIEIADAQDDLRSADTEVERLNAQAALITAQRNLAKARTQIADSYRNIDKAMAEATGDTVRAAQIEMDSIRAHLQEAQARGDKVGALEAQAQLIAQQRAVDQAQLSSAEQDIDFYKELGQATLGQTIASYEALLPLAAKNKDDYQALLLKINALRKEAGANVAFNIPTDIKLPTLYEVRRANQTADAGQGYQDNRIININFQATNTADAQAIATQIVDGFAGPSRVGTLPRRY
jgi:hypothetical protein